jgi:hypothetical protein
METIFSHRHTSETVIGEFYVTYSAINKFTGKRYVTVHLNPCGSSNDKDIITADKLQEVWTKRYKGRCPFNGDEGFEVIKIQQRTEF